MRILTLIWLVLFANIASADNAADATKSFEEGLTLQKEGKYADACGKFAKSFELDRLAGRPAPGTQLNLGDCAEREGQLRKAYVLFGDAALEYGRRAKAAETLLVKDPSSVELKRDLDRANAGMRLARERADALAPKLAKIVVRIAEPAVAGLAVRVGDRSVSPAAEVIEHLDPGNVTITASAPGREPFTTSAKAESGKQVVVEVPVLKVIGGAAGPIEDRASQSRRQRKRVLLAAGFGGTGIALLAVTAIVGLGANSQYKDAEAMCSPGPDGLVCPTAAAAEIDKAGSKADLATVLGIGGGALVVAGAVLFFTAPREGVAIGPMASPTTAGVSIRGRF